MTGIRAVAAVAAVSIIAQRLNGIRLAVVGSGAMRTQHHYVGI